MGFIPIYGITDFSISELVLKDVMVYNDKEFTNRTINAKSRNCSRMTTEFHE